MARAKKHQYRTLIRLETRGPNKKKEVFPAGSKLELTKKEAEEFGLERLQLIDPEDAADDGDEGGAGGADDK